MRAYTLHGMVWTFYSFQVSVRNFHACSYYNHNQVHLSEGITCLHNHCINLMLQLVSTTKVIATVLKLTATSYRVTTLWLKQPLCFCSEFPVHWYQPPLDNLEIHWVYRGCMYQVRKSVPFQIAGKLRCKGPAWLHTIYANQPFGTAQSFLGNACHFDLRLIKLISALVNGNVISACKEWMEP